jgi:hypothetical protein
VRGQGPHPGLQLAGRARGVEAALGRVDLLGVGGVPLVLLGELEALRGEQIEGLDQKLAAQLRQPRGEGAEILLATDLHLLAQRHRAGVEAGGKPHHAHPGLLVGCHQRPLDRGGAAPARQQRGMDVQQLEFGEQGLADQLPEGADGDYVRAGAPDRLQRRLGVDVLGLEQLNPKLTGSRCRGRRLQLPSPPLLAVRGRHHQRRPVRRIRQPAEDGGGELGGAEVDRPHASVRGSRSSPSSSPSSSAGGL